MATRAWANTKIKALVASTAAQFNDVETKMAKNRHEIDMALKQATMRFEASLNAQKALESKRYAQTVRNIQAARDDAKKKTAAAKTEFKVGLLQLASTVKEQVTKVNNRIDSTAGVVRSNRAAQAKVNANVNAEMGRMIKLGNKRYKQHLKNDIELQKLIQKGQAETNRKLDRMAMSFNQALASVRRQRLDAIDQVRKTKAQFRKKIHNLGVVVKKNDAKADKKINTEISKLRDETNASVEALALQSKEARSEMKKEMLYAIRSAADVAKRDLKIAIRDGINKMQAFQKRSAASHAKSALARKALASRIAANAKSVSRMIRDAVATDARSRLALKAETAKAIKKTNTRVDAYAARMRAQAKKARGEIKALATATVAKVRAEESRASQALAKFTSKDAARQKAALKFAAA